MFEERTFFHAEVKFTSQWLVLKTLRELLALASTKEKAEPLLLPIVVFMAFVMEAYINHLGEQLLDGWEQIERRPWREKIRKLHDKAAKECDWDKGPLQYASKIFLLRDKLAHGKPQAAVGEDRKDPEDVVNDMAAMAFRPDWLKSVDFQQIGIWQENFEDFLLYMGGLFDRHPKDHEQRFSAGIKQVTRKISIKKVI